MNDEELVFDEDSLQEYQNFEYQQNSRNDKSLIEKIDSAKKNIDLAKNMKASFNPKSEIKSNDSNINRELQKNKIENARKNNNLSNNKKNSQMTNKLASNALSKAGIPKPASDALVNSKLGQKALEAAKKKNPALNALDRIGSALDKKTSEENETQQGFQNVTVSKKTFKYALIIGGVGFSFVMLLVFFIVAPYTYVKTRVLGAADAVAGEDAAEKLEPYLDKAIEEALEDSIGYEYDENNIYLYNNSMSEFASNKLNNMNTLGIFSKRKYNESDLSKLEEFFGESIFDINADDMNTVYDFYFKLYDIYTRYSERCNVSLDMPLLMSTLYLESDNILDVFESNTEDYKHNEKKVSNYTEVMELDYDYDWSKYKISYKDSSHDIEVLAQHMVSKNSSGQYEIDNKKYREFLKEFIEKKYYLNKNKSYEMSNYKQNETVQVTPSTNKGNVSGEWTTWTQGNSKWGKMIIPSSSSTVGSIGCLMTSISIQIVRSGTEIKVDNFDPGVAVKEFTFANGGNLQSWNKVAPYFKRSGFVDVSGWSKQQIIDKLDSYPDNYYLNIYGVNRKGIQHHIVYLYSENGEIYVHDPANLNNKTVSQALAKIKEIRIYVRED